MTAVQEINRIEDLGEYRSAWDALLRQTRGASFFHSLEWLEVYWRHYGAGQKLRTLIVSSGGRPVGILPLVVRREATKIGKLWIATYPLHDWGSFYGPIGPDPEAILTAGLDHLRTTRRDWDVLELRWVNGCSTEPAETQQAMRTARFRAHTTIWHETAIIDLSDTWDAYLAGRGSKWRNNFRRWERNLGRRGEVTYVRYRPQGETHGDGDPRWDLYDACETIARRSWQGSSVTGTTLSHESVRPFLRETHAEAAKTGAVDINLLLVDGQPCAFAYNYHCRGSVYGLRVGYDATHARDGAGNLLYAYAIRDSFERGDHVYDLGVGSFDAKRQLLTHVVPILRYSHFSPAVPRAQILRLKRWMEARRLEQQQTTTPLVVLPQPEVNSGSLSGGSSPAVE